MADIPYAEADRQASFHWDPSPSKDDGWMDLKETSAYTKLPPDTLQQYVAEGLLRAFKPATSRQLRFRRSDIDSMFKPVEPTYRESKRQARINGEKVGTP